MNAQQVLESISNIEPIIKVSALAALAGLVIANSRFLKTMAKGLGETVEGLGGVSGNMVDMTEAARPLDRWAQKTNFTPDTFR